MTNDEKQRVTLFVNPEILKRARVQAVVEEISLTVLAERAIVRYLPKEIIIINSDVKKRKVVK